MNFAPATNTFNKELFSFTDYLILNEVEIEQLSNVEVNDIKDAENACLSLLNKYDVKLGVIVTLGANGVLFVERKTKESFHIQAQKVKVIDTSVY